MRVNFCAYVALAFLLSGCSQTKTNQYSVPIASVSKPRVLVALKASDEEFVKRAVAAQLKDPASAVFGRVYAIKDVDVEKLIHVCGVVNAKNSYGGYVGEQPFVSVVILSDNGPPQVPAPMIQTGDKWAIETFNKNCHPTA